MKNILKKLYYFFFTKLEADSVNHNDAFKWFDTGHKKYILNLVSSIENYIKEDSVIFDIGANIGFFTFIIGNKLSSQGSVHLFEPVPNLSEISRLILKEVKYKTNYYKFALGDSNGKESIFLANDGNLGWNTMIKEKIDSDMKEVIIDVRKYDSLDIKVEPTLIKIDTEGYEYKVLNGMVESMKKWSNLPIILCEIGWGKSHPSWDKIRNMVEMMQSLGYRICNLDKSSVNLDNINKTLDVLFLPSNVK